MTYVKGFWSKIPVTCRHNCSTDRYGPLRGPKKGQNRVFFSNFDRILARRARLGCNNDQESFGNMLGLLEGCLNGPMGDLCNKKAVLASA